LRAQEALDYFNAIVSDNDTDRVVATVKKKKKRKTGKKAKKNIFLSKLFFLFRLPSRFRSRRLRS
jgi:hypothetical protein